MTQRQIGDQSIILTDAKQLDGITGGEAEVGEVVHHAFGHAGGAGGIDDGGQLVGRRLGIVLNRCTALQIIPTEVEAALRVQWQADGHHPWRQPRRHRSPVIELADEGQCRLGMLQYLTHGVASEVGIQRHRDAARHPDRQIGDDPVRAVLGNDGDTTARWQFAAAQPTGRTPGLFPDLSPTQLQQLTATERLNHVALVRVPCFTFVKQLERQTDCISHRASSFVVFVGINQALAWLTIPREQKRCKLRNVSQLEHSPSDALERASGACSKVRSATGQRLSAGESTPAAPSARLPEYHLPAQPGWQYASAAAPGDDHAPANLPVRRSAADG